MIGKFMKNAGYLFILLIFALYMGCASQRGTLLEEEYTQEDDQFQSDLMDMLDMSDENVSGNEDFLSKLAMDEEETAPAPNQDLSPISQNSIEEESLQDVLALLLEEDAEQTGELPTTKESSPFDTADPVSSTDYTLKLDVQRMESEFANKSSKADSLRKLIEERNKRLQQLESKTSGIRPAGNAALSAQDKAAFSNGYKSARSLFETFNYSEALQAFQNLLNSFPNHRMADNCRYWIGECYFGQKQYDQAIAEFQKVFTYSQTDKHDDAQLMIALAYLRTGQRQQAKAEFETFFASYPDSEYMSVARNLHQKL